MRPDPESVIRLENVCKVFPNVPPGTPPALDNLTAHIPAGMVVGLVGPDASGKTTLMRLLAGLLLPSAGTVEVLGRVPDSSGNAANVLHDIGYMPQRFGLYEDLSVLDNLNLHAELRGLEGEARQRMFDRLLQFTDLKPFTGRLAGKLSGGMKQKLGLACALLTTPRLLLLDEPGVGVDPLSRRELWKMVSELAVGGMSVLWSTAYMEEAERCSHVLMLDQGRLVYQGPPARFTERVADRVFAFVPPPGEARRMLAGWQQAPDVRDALIQGSRIRLVFRDRHPGAFSREGVELLPVEARLEDAYIDAVGGMDRRPSPFLPGNGTDEEDGSRKDRAFFGRGLKFWNRDRKEAAPAAMTACPVVPSRKAPFVPEENPVIRAVGLTKRFGAFTAAHDITFDVLPGKIFGLLGPNGAGKSTTFRMLCGLSRPTEGACFVAGMNLLGAAGAARARLGYMAQKFSLYGELTVEQNMRLMAELYGLPGKRVAPRLEQLVEALDLEAFRKVRAFDLPLGQKQRLALACATLHEPSVLFLDEPTSGVDPRTRREFWKHINAMTQNGVAVLVTTHFMEEAEYCDEIALVFQGEIIARGTPDELRERAPYASKASPETTLEDAFIAYIERVQHPEGVRK